MFVRIVHTGKNRRTNSIAKGGGKSFVKYLNDIRLWLSSDHRASVCFTTFIDLYGFPNDQQSPIHTISSQLKGNDKVDALEELISQQVNDKRFIPYIQLHEFETFLFTQLNAIEKYFPETGSNIALLADETAQYSPEEINETPEGSPSHRIIKHIPKYAKEKSIAGPLIANEIGIKALRENCPHFNNWLTKLESV